METVILMIAVLLVGLVVGRRFEQVQEGKRREFARWFFSEENPLLPLYREFGPERFFEVWRKTTEDLLAHREQPSQHSSR